MQATDYERIARAIRFLAVHHQEQPSLEEVAAVSGLSKYHFQRVFRRWAGISPKRFVQYLTLDHARRLLADECSVLDTAYEVGLSAPSRLHDLFVTYEAVTPGEYRRRGEGLHIRWGIHPGPFGDVLVGQSARGLCALSFVAERGADDAVAALHERWAGAVLEHAPEVTAPTVDAVFGPVRDGSPRGLHLLLRGTPFQLKVWEALLAIPAGDVTTYSDVARRVCTSAARRAVGQAVGSNPVACVIPCHRVIRQDGTLGGYQWGEERKRALLAWDEVRAVSLSRSARA